MAEPEIQKDTIKEFYDKRYAGGYREGQKGLELYRIKHILKEVPEGIKTILDYGCGQGIWIDALSDRFPGSGICGIDISDRAVELAKARHPRGNFSSFDGEVAPFEDNSFDLVYSYHVLEHVLDIDKTFADFSRLLKKGGYLFIVLPCGNEGSFEEKITRLVHGGKETSAGGEKRFFYEDSGHLRRMESQDLIESLSRYDMAIVREYYSNQFWGAVGWIGRSGPAFIGELFNTKKGVDTPARIKLALLKTAFLVITSPLRLYKFNIRQNMKSAKSASRKTALAMLVPLKIVVSPFGLVIDLLSFLEWCFARKRKNGSAQYLIFRKA
jgi:ubiquinone/menaquinone biosynthesis C-methylase UbiE